MKYVIIAVVIMLSGWAHAATTPPTTCGSGVTKIDLPLMIWTNDDECPSGYSKVDYGYGRILGIDSGTTYKDDTGTFTVSNFCPLTE